MNDSYDNATVTGTVELMIGMFCSGTVVYWNFGNFWRTILFTKIHSFASKVYLFYICRHKNFKRNCICSLISLGLFIVYQTIPHTMAVVPRKEQMDPTDY